MRRAELSSVTPVTPTAPVAPPIPATSAPAPEQLRRAAEYVAPMLDARMARVLGEVASATLLLGEGEPYVALTPDDAHLAACLADQRVGLLVSERAGYTLAYRLTLLGRLVVRVYLLDVLSQRLQAAERIQAGQRG